MIFCLECEWTGIYGDGYICDCEWGQKRWAELEAEHGWMRSHVETYRLLKEDGRDAEAEALKAAVLS